MDAFFFLFLLPCCLALATYFLFFHEKKPKKNALLGGVNASNPNGSIKTYDEMLTTCEARRKETATQSTKLDEKLKAREADVAFYQEARAAGITDLDTADGVRNLKILCESRSLDAKEGERMYRSGSSADIESMRHEHDLKFASFDGYFRLYNIMSWVPITGYMRYLYGHYIELENLKSMVEHFGGMANTSTKLSIAPAHTSDPFIAGGMAEGLFGSAAGLAAYSNTVIENAKALEGAEKSRLANYNSSVAFASLSHCAEREAEKVSAAIEAFKAEHPIDMYSTDEIIKRISFTPLKAEALGEVLFVHFECNIEGEESFKVLGKEAVAEGCFVVGVKSGDRLIGKSFISSNFYIEDDKPKCFGDLMFDYNEILNDIKKYHMRSLGQQSSAVFLKAKNVEYPNNSYIPGYINDRVYCAPIMFEKRSETLPSFEDLSFEIEPVCLWLIAL